MKKTIIFSALAFVIGYLIADYIALRYAKSHGIHKYGGIFQDQPKAGLQ